MPILVKEFVTRMELWTGEMSLTRFEESWPLSMESLPELP